MSSDSDIIEPLSRYAYYTPYKTVHHVYHPYNYWLPNYWWSWWSDYPYEYFDGQDSGVSTLWIICIVILVLLCASSLGFIH